MKGKILILLKYIVKKIWSYQHAIFLGICILFISIISFNLGKIYALQKTPIQVLEGANIYNATSENSKFETLNSKQILNTKSKIQNTSRVVVSKNSDKYHYETCGSWRRIKDENQIWFDSANKAEKAGYVLAGNCQP
jgi:hypothetical protein